MNTSRILLLAALALPMMASVGHGASDCKDNDVTGATRPGALEITDYAVTDYYTSCPPSAEQSGTELAVPNLGRIYFWIRVEGDKTFVQGLGNGDKFAVSIHRKGDFSETDSRLEIKNPRILQDDVLREAAANPSGHFDWRFRSVVHSYLVPGDYTFNVTFGGRGLCFHATAPCAPIKIKITE